MALDWKNNVMRAFDHYAPEYDTYCDIQKLTARHLMTKMPALTHGNILEIGCGTGELTQHLVRHYPDCPLHITDISKTMLEIARAKSMAPSHNITWEHIDGEKLTTSNRYDLIVSNLVFHWFENPYRNTVRLLKYLKPQGRLIYSVPGPCNFQQWTDILKQLNFPVYQDPYRPVGQYYDDKSFYLSYKSAYDFLKSIKKTGTATKRAPHTSLKAHQLKHACQRLDSHGNIRMRWHILFETLYAHHHKKSESSL